MTAKYRPLEIVLEWPAAPAPTESAELEEFTGVIPVCQTHLSGINPRINAWTNPLIRLARRHTDSIRRHHHHRPLRLIRQWINLISSVYPERSPAQQEKWHVRAELRRHGDQFIE